MNKNLTDFFSAIITGFGTIVEIIYGNSIFNEKNILGNINIDDMSGEDFEKYLEYLFIDLGYKVIRTQLSGDQGADLIIEKNNIKTVIQAKRWGNKITNKAIQEVYAAQTYYEAQQAMVITNNQYTKSAIDLATKIGVILYNREKLLELIKKSKKHW